MPIEVKQLIIKSTVTDERRDREDAALDPADMETLKQQVIDECRELIERNLEKSKER